MTFANNRSTRQSFLTFVAVFFATASASAEMDLPGTIKPFRPLPSNEDISEPAEGEYKYGDGIIQWRFVRPHWLVATIENGPVLPGLPIPKNLPKPVGVGVVAVDPVSTRAIEFRLSDDALVIKSVLPLRDHVCGIVAYEKGRQRLPEMTLYAWDLRKNIVRRVMAWDNIDPIARHLDLDRVDIRWPQDEELTPESSRISIAPKGADSTSSLPLHFVDYEIPVQMSSLWEGKNETRWYAPSDDGIGIVCFQGPRDEWDVDVPYSQRSTITMFDPAAKDGVRWRKSLGDFGIGREVLGVLPIASPWKMNTELILQFAKLGYHFDPVPVDLIKINLRDGTALSNAKFEADRGFKFGGDWPQCTDDLNRVVYLVERPRYSQKLEVFSFADGTFIDEVGCPNNGRIDLLAVLPNDEAVVQEHAWSGTKLWAIGVGAENLGKTRLIVELQEGVDESVE